MFKKNILILFIACGAWLVQVTDAMAEFDPESAEFSKKATLKTWVRSDISDNTEVMKMLQDYIASLVPENPDSRKVIMPVLNDAWVMQNFGYTFQTIPAIELPLLKYIHEISQDKCPITLEIAAGAGLASWPILYAFEKGGTHYINELSSKMLQICTELIIPKFVHKNLRNFIKIVPGSCFDILNKEPALRENVHVLYAKNFENFLDPVQHVRFLELIENLLTEDGCAFLCAEALPSAVADLETPIFNSLLNIKGPNDNTAMGLTTLTGGYPDGWHPFSPLIYKLAVAKRPRLLLIDTFYIDIYGSRVNALTTTVRFAAAIIRKKNRNELLSSYSDSGKKIGIKKVIPNVQPSKSGTSSSFLTSLPDYIPL